EGATGRCGRPRERPVRHFGSDTPNRIDLRPSAHRAIGMSDGIEIRRATDDDDPAVLSLLRSALKWGTDERFTQFFEWKHRLNPFGRSPAWVAANGDRI